MLSCKDVTERASDLIDGNLSPMGKLRIRMHLAMCKGCARFIQQMRVTDQLTAEIAKLGEPQTQPADDGRYAEILSMLHNEKTRR